MTIPSVDLTPRIGSELKLDKAARIPAVVHKDQTLRPQTVEKEINPRYWKLLAELFC